MTARIMLDDLSQNALLMPCKIFFLYQHCALHMMTFCSCSSRKNPKRNEDEQDEDSRLPQKAKEASIEFIRSPATSEYETRLILFQRH